LIYLGIVVIENSIISTCDGRDGVASVAFLDDVSSLAVFGREGGETEDGADGEVSAFFVVFPYVERCELESGNVVLSRDFVAVVAFFDGVGPRAISSKDRVS
jgi:hypothetical protein